jgi:hypothetical protein
MNGAKNHNLATHLAAAGAYATPPVPETILGMEIASVEGYLNELDAAVHTLTNRLSPVLRPDNVQPILTGNQTSTGGRVERANPLSPTAERIAKLRKRVQGIAAHVHCTLDRLEA